MPSNKQQLHTPQNIHPKNQQPELPRSKTGIVTQIEWKCQLPSSNLEAVKKWTVNSAHCLQYMCDKRYQESTYEN